MDCDHSTVTHVAVPFVKPPLYINVNDSLVWWVVGCLVFGATLLRSKAFVSTVGGHFCGFSSTSHDSWRKYFPSCKIQNFAENSRFESGCSKLYYELKSQKSDFGSKIRGFDLDGSN